MIYMSNPSTCYCECDRACKVGEFLGIKNCSYNKIFPIN